ncbi:MAG: hypothetical protein KAR79_00525 [Simkaniaceae bacterium]|nr:hypothetical protein [Simkaniaceae bacterium]
MTDEFKKIMEFFTLDPEEKASHLNEVFDDSIAFFEKFKYIIEKGTPEQKKEMIEHAAALQNKLRSETTKICDSTGLTEEELEAFSTDANNFSEEQWSSIQHAKVEIDKQATDISSMINLKKPESNEHKPRPPKKGKGPSSKRSGWVRS